ncbi:DUF2157 domain-containing protein [Bradyrhizobium japonicum]
MNLLPSRPDQQHPASRQGARCFTTMFDKTYRQRLEADLAQWEADGVIAPAAATSIRSALPPLSPGINIAVVVAIVGGLLIAAAFLAFVAAHWTEIARLLRFAILVAGMVVAGGLGAWFAATGRTVLADLCASIGRSSSARASRWSARCIISARTSPAACCCGRSEHLPPHC